MIVSNEYIKDKEKDLVGIAALGNEAEDLIREARDHNVVRMLLVAANRRTRTRKIDGLEEIKFKREKTEKKEKKRV